MGDIDSKILSTLKGRIESHPPTASDSNPKYWSGHNLTHNFRGHLLRHNLKNIGFAFL
jgi:hypothetical protein